MRKKLFKPCQVKYTIFRLFAPVFGLLLLLSPLNVVAEDLHIAMVGPITGKSPANGRHHKQGIMLLLDKINEKGGINGKKVVLDVFDDQNAKTICREKALEVATQSRALAVIGHNYSSCSISAGPVYKEHELVAISPSSTHADVTVNNDWVFRTIFNNNLQARFLANYAKSIFQAKNIVIVHEDLAFGSHLAREFGKTARELDINISEKYKIVTKDANLDDAIERIVLKIKEQKNVDIIFLATHDPEGIKFIKHFKDHGLRIPIIGSSAFASDAFANGFNEFSKEKLIPGYYTNGIYVTSPIIFDNADQKAQKFNEEYFKAYNEKTDWRAAFAYDAALLLIEAIKNTNITGDPDKIKQERKIIRDYLAKLDSVERSIEGITGFNYFDKNGNPQKPISIGNFHNRNIISSLTQLRAIRSLGEITNLEKELESKRVLLIDDRFMYQTKVVYTGIEFNEISELDMDKLTCMVDFNLWFRYQGDFDVSNVSFVNADESVTLGKPVKEYVYEQINYRSYHVRGRFKLDTFEGVRPYGQHSLGISFVHNDMTNNNLIFVKDLIGLGDFTESKSSNEYWSKILRPVYGWSIQNMSFYQTKSFKSVKGEPKYLNARNGLLEFSKFNVEVSIRENKASIRGVIPWGVSNYVTIFSFFALLLLIIENKYSFFNPSGKSTLLLWTVVWLSFLLSLETTLIGLLTNQVENYVLNNLTLSFDALWWVVPALLIIKAVELFVWSPLEKKTGQIIPKMIRRIAAFIIILIACFGVIAFVFDQKLTSLLATSGVLAMIIGLAVQMNLANIFSGIAINIERPFTIGDWIEIGSFKGKVVGMNWRATQIMSLWGRIISIPNSEAASSVIENHNLPDDSYWVGFTVHVDFAHDSKKVEKILTDAVLATEDISDPWVLFGGVSDWAADYWVYALARDFGTNYANKSKLWTTVKYHLEKAGIEMIIQRQEIVISKNEPNLSQLPPSDLKPKKTSKD